ncbi:hypothetical protein FL583_00960 [Cryptosporangium phraense]|uniref:VOC family protein n=1 Tax=Cryptosporangium phraense TaxID=2593070 RepID=A0A545B0K9_9ACTN|nr:hypothetical protein FL583_00960 [Cryptosporangium phraense]
MTLTTVNLSTPDPPGLARFYARLLGWEIASEEPTFVSLRPPDGGVGPAEWQPQEDVRVYLDPAGHPFCLWLG